MSPFKSLEEYVAGEATFKVADHLIAGCSSMLNYNGIRQYLVGPASFVLYKFRGKPVYRLGETCHIPEETRGRIRSDYDGATVRRGFKNALIRNEVVGRKSSCACRRE